MTFPTNDQLDELVDTDPLRLRDAALALLARAKNAEATLDTTRALAQTYADMAPPGNIATNAGFAADIGRAFLAVLGQAEASAIICSRCHGHPAEREFDVCESCVDELAAINRWAANLDPRGEAT